MSAKSVLFALGCAAGVALAVVQYLEMLGLLPEQLP
jgi:hypothetical protein